MKAASGVSPEGYGSHKPRSAQPSPAQQCHGRHSAHLLPGGAGRGDMMSLVFITLQRGDRKTRPRGGSSVPSEESKQASSLLAPAPEMQE